MDLTLFFSFAVDTHRRMIHDALTYMRDHGKPFETHNSLTRSWNHLPYPIPVTVWFQYYRKMEAFVRSSEFQSHVHSRHRVFSPQCHFV